MARALVVEILGDARQFAAEMDRAAGKTRRFGAAAKVASGLLVGALAIGLEKSVKAAIDAQAAQARLEQAFHNVGLSADAYTKQINNAEEAGRKLGFADDVTTRSLGSLVAATHDVNAALKDLSVAQDLARFKHVDLEQATKMLTMAMTGSQRAVKQLGIVVAPVTAAVDALRRSHMDLTTEAGRAALAQAQLQDKMATGQAVIAATTNLVHGQAQAYSETAAGGMAAFLAQLNHLEIEIGSVLLPVLTQLLAKVNELAADFNANLGPAVDIAKQAFDRFHGSTVLLYTLFLPVREMLKIWSVEMLVLKAAVDATTVAFGAVRGAAVAVAGFFAGVFQAAVSALHSAWNGLASAVSAVRSALEAALGAARSVAGFVGGGLTAALNAFRSVARGVSAVIDAIAGALRAAADAARALAGALSSIHVPHISLPHISIPHIGIPHAAGGPVLAGTSYLVGERGPEMFTPGASGFITPNSGLGGDLVVHSVTYLDGKVIYENWKKQAARDMGRNGGTGIRA